MPRNGEGIYSLPQAAFVPGTTISSAAVNSDFSDIASALTMSISSDGQTPITGALRSSAAAPAYTSVVDDTSGLAVSAASAAILIGGADIAVWSATGEVLTGTLSVSSDTTVGGNLTVTGNMAVDGSFSFTGTAGIEIPDGTTGQRPGSPVAATIRFNSTLNRFEGYDGTEWVPMSNISTAYTISATIGSNLLAISILNATTGVAPTAADPIGFVFGDATLANGDPVSVVVNSALGLSTNGVGASLGSSNGVPFRFWVVVFNNGGTPVLGLINCSTPGVIYPLIETVLHSSTAISSGATSAGVFYTPNGTTVSNSIIKILGYVEYANGLTTAGTYASLPTGIRLFNAGSKKPGDIVQVFPQLADSSGAQNTTATFTVTPLAKSIVLTSSVNQVQARAEINVSGGNNGSFFGQLGRNSNSNLFGTIAGLGNTGTVNYCSPISGMDQPGTVSSTTYGVYIKGNANTSYNGFAGGGIASTLELSEVMG